MKLERAKVEYWAKPEPERQVDSYPLHGETFRFSPYANTPSVAALVDEIPQIFDLCFREREGIWYAEKEGFASFLWHPNDGKNHKGFGGIVYELPTEEGVVRLAGPWSSNSAAVNSKGFGPCIEVALTDDEEAWERGYTFLARAMTIELLLQSAEVFEELPTGFMLFVGKIGFNYFPLPVKKSWSGQEVDSRLIEIRGTEEAWV